MRLYDNRDYELTVRQEPKQARMCGVGGKGAFPLHNSSPFHSLFAFRIMLASFSR